MPLRAHYTREQRAARAPFFNWLQTRVLAFRDQFLSTLSQSAELDRSEWRWLGKVSPDATSLKTMQPVSPFAAMSCGDTVKASVRADFAWHNDYRGEKASCCRTIRRATTNARHSAPQSLRTAHNRRRKLACCALLESTCAAQLKRCGERGLCFRFALANDRSLAEKTFGNVRQRTIHAARHRAIAKKIR